MTSGENRERARDERLYFGWCQFGGFTIGAQHAHETLGDNQAERHRDKKRLHLHINEARDDAGAVIRVERGKHHVPRERRLHRKAGSLAVANLADHDDVRVLPQYLSQPRREVVTDLRDAPATG